MMLLYRLLYKANTCFLLKTDDAFIVLLIESAKTIYDMGWNCIFLFMITSMSFCKLWSLYESYKLMTNEWMIKVLQAFDVIQSHNLFVFVD